MGLCIAALLASQLLQAAPEPAAITNPLDGGLVSPEFAPSLVPKSWQLRFRFTDPQRLSVFLPGHDRPVVYWYMTYAIMNAADKEVEFYPEFELVTDTLEVIRSERQVSPEAFQAVQRRSGDPFLVEPEKVIGPIQQGEDRARHSVAIFRDFDPEARMFQVYVAGLSGEIKRFKNPAFDPSQPESDENERYFTLRKTLEIPYRFPGSPATRSRVVPERLTEEQRWIMR